VERAAGLSVTPPGADEGADELGPHLPGLDPRQLADRLLYTPTINISAMDANESGRLDDYLDHIRFSYRVLERLGEEIAQPNGLTV